MSFGNWLWPLRRRQLFSAASASLKIMASAVLFERHPLERTVRWRTVANELSMTLVVRRCFQCSAGKPAPLQVEKQFLPRLRALAHAVDEPDELLLPPRPGATPHPHPLPLVLHAALPRH